MPKDALKIEHIILHLWGERVLPDGVTFCYPIPADPLMFHDSGTEKAAAIQSDNGLMCPPGWNLWTRYTRVAVFTNSSPFSKNSDFARRFKKRLTVALFQNSVSSAHFFSDRPRPPISFPAAVRASFGLPGGLLHLPECAPRQPASFSRCHRHTSKTCVHFQRPRQRPCRLPP